MHELSLCGSIADIASRHAAGRTVTTIHIQVGQLRQIVPDTLIYCWDLVCADTPLEGSKIEVDHIPARMKCRKCGTSALVGDLPVFACPECHAVEAEIISGEEFMITSLELAGEEPAEDELAGGPAEETGT